MGEEGEEAAKESEEVLAQLKKKTDQQKFSKKMIGKSFQKIMIGSKAFKRTRSAKFYEGARAESEAW